MVTKTRFADLGDGRIVHCYTITNAVGASVRLLEIGATLQGVIVPDREGKMENVVLHYEDIEHYLHTPTYAGAICGRVANRVGGAAFNLNGQSYALNANDGPNQLHGGPCGFHQKLWNAEMVGENAVRFTLTSPDGDEHYPGTLRVSVTYTFDDSSCIAIDYEAISDQDTLCSLTNHAYWSLGGYNGADPLEQMIEIDADFFTPIDREVMPIGAIAPVAGPFDLRTAKAVKEGKGSTDPQIALVGGYDHNFVLRGMPGELRRAACLTDMASGRRMEVYTTMPGLQFFSGSQQPEGYTGVALETQCFPNAMRYWWFPSIILRAGEMQRSHTEYRLSCI